MMSITKLLWLLMYKDSTDSLEWLDPSVAEECDLVVPAGDGPRPARRRALLRLLVDEQVLAHAEPLCSGNKSYKMGRNLNPRLRELTDFSAVRAVMGELALVGVPLRHPRQLLVPLLK